MVNDATIMALAAKIYRDGRDGPEASAAAHINAIAFEIRRVFEPQQAPIVIDSKPTEFDRRHMAATIAGGIVTTTETLWRADVTPTTTTTIARNALAIADAILRESKES